MNQDEIELKSTIEAVQLERRVMHQKIIVPISLGRAYIRCSCGWESMTGHDTGEKFVSYYREAEEDFLDHVSLMHN